MPSETAMLPEKTILLSSTYATFRQQLAESNCSKCPSLCQERHTIVVDRGNPQTNIMIIGEAPGENEDLQGRAFVGRGGKLLDDVLASIGLDTNRHTLIANVVKCRPPKNRPPTQQEAENCFPYLTWQLAHVKPKIVLLMGATAAKHLIPEQKDRSMKDRVGRLFDVAAYPETKFLILFHPAYLLRDPRKKKDMLEHLQVLKKWLNENNYFPLEAL
jgi:uracil-DNA glycosylase